MFQSQEENFQPLNKLMNSVISSDGCTNDQVVFGMESTVIGSSDTRAFEVQNTNTDLFIENSICASNLQNQVKHLLYSFWLKDFGI